MRIVLVADHQATIRELVKIALEHKGCRVCEASEGMEALRAAWEMHPHLIILDPEMRSNSGQRVIDELRAHPELGRIPVMALVGNVTEGDRERALAAGFTGYLEKPVHLNVLRTEAERLLTGLC